MAENHIKCEFCDKVIEQGADIYRARVVDWPNHTTAFAVCCSRHCVTRRQEKDIARLEDILFLMKGVPFVKESKT